EDPHPCYPRLKLAYADPLMSTWDPDLHCCDLSVRAWRARRRGNQRTAPTSVSRRNNFGRSLMSSASAAEMTKKDTTGTSKLPARLHHTAYTTKDMEKTRKFYEEIIGLPLVATWSEADELFGKLRVYCHCFFALADGGALAFFQFADKSDEREFSPE